MASIVLSRVGLAMSEALVAVRGRSLRVLTYHRVRDLRGASPEELTGIERGVDLRAFEYQMRTLREKFNVVGPDHVEAWLHSKMDLPPRATLVTFDDGYRDLFDNALPILKRYQVPAIVFLPSSYTGTQRLFWWDRLALSLRSLCRSLDDQGWLDRECPPDVASSLRRIHVMRGGGKTSAIESVANGLKSLAPVHLEHLVEKLWVLAGSPSPSPSEYAVLSWDQVREMAKCGVSFGSHTANHPILTAVDPDEAEREVRDSKRRIESELGRPVTAFCYPSGAYSNHLAQIVSRSGFACAFSTATGINRRGADPFALKRVGVDGLPGHSFEVRLSDAYHQLRQLVRRS